MPRQCPDVNFRRKRREGALRPEFAYLKEMERKKRGKGVERKSASRRSRAIGTLAGRFGAHLASVAAKFFMRKRLPQDFSIYGP